LKTAQADSHLAVNDFVKQSITSLQVKDRQSLNESLLVGALADYVVNGSARNEGGGAAQSIDLDSVKLRNIGEEILTDKINRIFDDLKQDDKEFEASYQGLSQSKQRPEAGLKESILVTSAKKDHAFDRSAAKSV